MVSSVVVLNFALNALIVVVLLAFSRTSLDRIRKVMDILNDGGWRDCPYYVERMENGRRWYDKQQIKEKGGEKL